jgi:hypothetical protein
VEAEASRMRRNDKDGSGRLSATFMSSVTEELSNVWFLYNSNLKSAYAEINH